MQPVHRSLPGSDGAEHAQQRPSSGRGLDAFGSSTVAERLDLRAGLEWDLCAAREPDACGDFRAVAGLFSPFLSYLRASAPKRTTKKNYL